MTTTTILESEALIELFETLLDKPITVKELSSPAANSKGEFYSVYGGSMSEIKAVCICDLAFVNSTGGALALIPPGAVNDSTEAGECPDNLFDNHKEVMNLCAGLFPALRSATFSLQGVCKSTSELHDELVEFINDESVERRDIQIDIESYGKGFLSILVRD